MTLHLTPKCGWEALRPLILRRSSLLTSTLEAMGMTDIVDLEEAFTKSGEALFKELYRIYPVADPEDYFKQSQWKNELMKADLKLIEAHRRESGAPDVPDLEDVKAPSMPNALGYAPTPAMVSAGVFGQQGTVGPASLKPVGLAPTVPLAVAGAGSSPVVEIRLIALFVAKWKLDPASAKTLLAKLTPARRRYVIQNFKATATGVEGTKELGDYIATCEIDGSWDAAPAAANGTPAVAGVAVPAAKAAVGPTPAVVAANPALSGLKRPLTPSGLVASQMNAKRPALGGLLKPAGFVRPPGSVVPPWGKGAW